MCHVAKIREDMLVSKRMGALLKECIVELIGTLILCAFGNASNAVWVLDPNKGSFVSKH